LLDDGDRAPRGNYDIHLASGEFSRDFGEALAASLTPAIFDCDSATLDPAEFAQAMLKSGSV
jgi:hypothetical protein